MNKINLAVIFGGKSDEHEVSLSSAAGVIGALNEEKYNIVYVAIRRDGKWLIGDDARKYLELGNEFGIESREVGAFLDGKDNALEKFIEKDVDLILPILHGPYGEDGKLQGLLDMFEMKYVFSKSLAHSIAMNKAKAKVIVEKVGVPVAADKVIEKRSDLNKVVSEIDFPIVIKPLELGSSIGVSIAKNEDEFEKGVSEAFKYDSKVILEEFVKGREFTVTVIGNENPEVLAVTEVLPMGSEFYDYKSKYEEGGSSHVCPAEISDEVASEMKRHALSAYQSIGCRDLSRVDFIWDEENEKIVFIEINTIPGMTPTSLAPEAAQVAGMNFTQFLDRIIEGAMNH
ncbi:D-alanine--D-alanine ligase [Patescibacteria group bacterium]